jgi:hypothetical protein
MVEEVVERLHILLGTIGIGRSVHGVQRGVRIAGKHLALADNACRVMAQLSHGQAQRDRPPDPISSQQAERRRHQRSGEGDKKTLPEGALHSDGPPSNFGRHSQSKMPIINRYTPFIG